MMRHGCLSGQLYKRIEGGSSYVNVAVWESAQDIARAGWQPRVPTDHRPATRSHARPRPNLFKKVAVPGVCVACDSASDGQRDISSHEGGTSL
jgi:hypothetical protein